jgi:hypothetical protein
VLLAPSHGFNQTTVNLRYHTRLEQVVRFFYFCLIAFKKLHEAARSFLLAHFQLRDAVFKTATDIL